MAPVRIGRVASAGPWRASAATPSHNLPFARTRIFGRADEIELVRRDLDEARRRLVRVFKKEPGWRAQAKEDPDFKEMDWALLG